MFQPFQEVFDEMFGRNPRAQARKALTRLARAQRDLSLARINTTHQQALLDIASLDEHLARQDLTEAMRSLYPNMVLPHKFAPLSLSPSFDFELELEESNAA